MAKTTFRRVTRAAHDNDTWLAPYVGYLVKLVEYKNGKKTLHLDGARFEVSGTYTSTLICTHTGQPRGYWNYTIKKVLSKPIGV